MRVGIAICFEKKIEKKGHGKKLKNENLDKWKALAEIYTMHSFAQL